MFIFIFSLQTPIEDNKDFAILKFHAGPPYEVRTVCLFELSISFLSL